MHHGKHPFYDALRAEIARLGGYLNAHLHLDRAGTLDDRYLGRAALDSVHVSLHEKHRLIHSIHRGPAYEVEDFRRRIREQIEIMKACNTRRADTLVDVTADEVGLTALDVMLDLKRECAGSLDLRVAAYSPFGFQDAEPSAWEIFEAGARNSDFIAALPEADDTDEYPGHIGAMEHCKRMLELAQSLGRPLHVHTDQRNEPTEAGTEQLVEAVRRFGAPKASDGEPMVWAIHAISPSTYDDDRFYRLAADLAALDIGVICCPSAALGMRQLRPLRTPTWNSIPRVLELLTHGVRVRIASDNVADICSPSTTADLTDELFMLSAALRFFHVGILAKLGAGLALTPGELTTVAEHVKDDSIAVMEAVRALDQKTLP